MFDWVRSQFFDIWLDAIAYLLGDKGAIVDIWLEAIALLWGDEVAIAGY